MERINKLIYNSFVYRFIEWVCLSSQKSKAFKAVLMMKYKEKKYSFLNHGTNRLLIRFGKWVDRKAKASMLYRMINKSSRFLNKNSQVARAISKIQWIYFLPFFVWIDRLIRVYDIPLASLWDEAYMLFLVLIIAYRRWFKDIKYYFTTIDRGIVFFGFIYLIITFLNSTDILIGLEGYRVVTQYILTFFIVVQLADTEKRIVNIIWLFMISIGLLGLHGVYQFATGAPMLGNWVDSGEDISTRAYSILGSPNALASILVLFLPVSFSMFIAEKNVVRNLVALVIAIVIGIGLVFTFSRGAWAAAGVAMIILLFFLGKRLILFFLSLASLAIFGLDQIYSRVYYLLTPEYLAKSARGGRMYRYAEALGQWSAEGKWFGLGVGRFGGAVATNHGLSPFYMDSFFLKTLAEAGLIGLISYVGLVLNTMVQSYKYILGTKNSQYRVVMYGLFAGMIGVLIHNVVENIFEIPYMVTYFWAMAALIVSLQREDSKKREVSNS